MQDRTRPGQKNPSKETENTSWIPVIKRLDGDFVASTWRYFFYAIFLTVSSASLAFLFPIPIFNPFLAVGLEFGPFIALMYYHYWKHDYNKAFYAFLIFAGMLGLVLGPQLALLAATIPNGMFIITLALATTVAQTLMLHNYAWFKAKFTGGQISLLGSFLSTALTGLILVGLINIIFPTPVGMLLYSAAGVGIFSLYLVYDVYLLKIGAFKTPIEAALNLYLDVVNLFLETLMLYVSLQNTKSESAGLGNFIMTRILPIVFILGKVLNFGYLESRMMEPKRSAKNDDKLPQNAGDVPLGNMAAQQPTTVSNPNTMQGFQPARAANRDQADGTKKDAWRNNDPYVGFGYGYPNPRREDKENLFLSAPAPYPITLK
jgi:modulator of FtsH protease